MNFKLKDGYTLNVSDQSSMTYIQFTAVDFNAVQNVIDHLTEDNLKRVELGEQVGLDLRLGTITATKVGTSIEVGIALSEPTEAEKQAQINLELQMAIASLAEGMVN